MKNERNRVTTSKGATMLLTSWEVWVYDVWGNSTEGYEVNDRCCIHRKYDLAIPVTTCNVGTPSQFSSVCPTERQIREALGIKPHVAIATDGDDLTIYVTAESDGYPFGELFCTSHENLSPIGDRKEKKVGEVAIHTHNQKGGE